MSKDFAKEIEKLEKKQQQKVFTQDPYLVTNEIIESEITASRFILDMLITPTKALGWAILSPLNVIAAALQMSVISHLGIHSLDRPVNATTKALQKIKVAKDLTIRQKRNLEIKIYSGSGNQTPYTAPIYTSPKNAFQELMLQGKQAFWKGFTPRLLINWINWCWIFPAINNRGSDFINNYFTVLLSQISLNPWYIMESRYILQNPKKQFRSYPNYKKFFKQLKGKAFSKGSGAHFMTSFFAVGALEVSKNVETQIQILKNLQLFLVYRILAFPVNTAYRRFIGQSEKQGMIPERYSGIIHALRLIFQEQHRKGLYKGFWLDTAYIGLACVLGSFIDDFYGKRKEQI